MYFKNFTSFNFFYFLVSPDPPDNCTIINKSSESFHLQCIPGNLFAICHSKKSIYTIRPLKFFLVQNKSYYEFVI